MKTGLRKAYSGSFTRANAKPCQNGDFRRVIIAAQLIRKAVMNQAEKHTARQTSLTVLGIKRRRYNDLAALAKKHAAIATEYAEKAKQQLADIERSEIVHARLYK